MVTLWGYDISWFVWFCASGKAFFVGAAFLILAILLSLFRKRTWGLIATYISTVVGVLLIILSATPFPLWFYLVWIIVFFSFILPITLKIFRFDKFLMISRVAAVSLCLVAVITELPFYIIPVIPSGRFERLYVIGDSVSAGIGGKEEETWPVILRKRYGVEVVDLSVSGATVKTAIKQAEQIKSENAIVLLEIGGNDLFAETPYNEFEEALRAILQKVSGAKRAVVMFELPLMPLHIKYGQTQRELAREFNAILVPKRFFANVLKTKGATADLAHLSPEGHQLMANEVWVLLRHSLVHKVEAQ